MVPKRVDRGAVSRVARALALVLFSLATPVIAESSETVTLEAAPKAVRDAAAKSYDGLLYEIGDYVRHTWRVEGVFPPKLTARLSNDALAHAVRPESDRFSFQDTAAAADRTLLLRIAFENRVRLAQQILERLTPVLTSALCGKGGVLEELDNVQLKDVVEVVAVALGFSSAGAPVSVVPVVVIAVSAIIVKAGIREYCLTAGVPKITGVKFTAEGDCLDFTVTGAGFKFGSTVHIEGPLGTQWPTTYVSPAELRTRACWMQGITKAERPKKSVVNVVTPGRVSSDGWEITW